MPAFAVGAMGVGATLLRSALATFLRAGALAAVTAALTVGSSDFQPAPEEAPAPAPKPGSRVGCCSCGFCCSSAVEPAYGLSTATAEKDRRLRPLPLPLSLLILERELAPAAPAVSPLRPDTLREETSLRWVVFDRGSTDTGTATDPRALPLPASQLPTPAPMTSVMLSLRPTPPATPIALVAPPRAIVCAVTAALLRLLLRTSATARTVPAMSTAAPTAPPIMAAPWRDMREA